METNKKQEVREIVKRLSSLIDENGPVYVWDNEGVEPSNVRRFGTEENAREFVSLKKRVLFPSSTLGAFLRYRHGRRIPKSATRLF